MDSKKKIIEMLNEDLGDELASIIQYMWHHVMVAGPSAPGAKEEFMKAARDEMKHAEMLAEKVNYLGGVPTTKHEEIRVGGDLKKMLSDNLEHETRAIARYKKQIASAAVESEPAIRHMLEEILEDEEDHADIWQTMLEGL